MIRRMIITQSQPKEWNGTRKEVWERVYLQKDLSRSKKLLRLKMRKS